MIAKNEEAYLPQCLESVKGLVREIILVDTGSTDSTVQIAKSFGARIFTSAWQNNFSAPRNLSLSMATSEWILVLDADEAIDSSQHEQIRSLCSDKRFCYALTQRHYLKAPHITNFKPVKGAYPQWEKGALGYFDSDLVRLVPNSLGLQFRGVVHELLEHSIAEHNDLTVSAPGIIIHHYGHLKEGGPASAKYDLYTKLGEEKIRKENDWKSFYELAVQYQNNKDWDKSIDAFQKSLAQNPRNVAAYVNLAQSLGEIGRLPEAEKSLEQALQLMPNNNEAWCNLGVVQMRRRDYEKAARCLLKAVQINKEHVNAWLNLGESMFFLKRLKDAAQSFDNALRLTPDNARALEGLATCYLFSGNMAQAEKILLHTIEKHPQTARLHYLLAQTYKASKRAELAVRELERSCKLANEAEKDLAKVCQDECLRIKASLPAVSSAAK